MSQDKILLGIEPNALPEQFEELFELALVQLKRMKKLMHEEGLNFPHFFKGYKDPENGVAFDFYGRVETDNDLGRFTVPDDSKVIEWLSKNANRFGFIIRYPKGKEEITGHSECPWHIRYVGKCSTYMHRNNLCLEEYIEKVYSDGIKVTSTYQEAKKHFQKMRKQMEEEGFEFTSIISGHREGEDGIVFDFWKSVAQNLKVGESPEDSSMVSWINDHAHEFGMVVRYPEGKEEITGHNYEPWKLRYLGEKLAQVLHSNNLCLEEYTQEQSA